MSKWQPLNDEARSGADILIWLPNDRMYIAAYDPNEEPVGWWDPFDVLIATDDRDFTSVAKWRPLPKPPRQDQ